MSIQIAPSLLSADFANLERDVLRCQNAGAEVLHIDVMDGHFVPNITIGPLVVNALRPKSKMIFDCHLMISNPDQYVSQFAEAGADWISIHVETTNHLHRSIDLIKKSGVKAGAVVNPLTPLTTVYDALEYLDFVLLMSVNPGFGGQSFIPSFLKKCETLKTFLVKNSLDNIAIEVDGGVKLSNVRDVVSAGASIIVSGSGLFSGNLEQNIQEMKNAVIDL
ncbi:MAG: ribulose-phosphate 3-epimerase [Candidatus Kapabacteria bacterium]|nr:ribulose-phosphate 3-epimerase [Candidatus Kapabacteria bacterium]